ncbi:metallophosphoesterase family protein [Methanococcoides seepicolus]|jgi:putative phosphoesterase|uniref:Phosphoesterase n=1 Tax=Methanococcoides seepicolus TaxID=2828780 RepID=A0A9E5DAJ3_9EURY|nr:metallophosphoesterase [Methanococcoides seepicolus]MCM1985992.1 metallophosphoesterase [Methanococcoides seepicolus]
MKILAISDTHLKEGDIPPTFKGLLDDCDIIAHAGDFTSTECYNAFAATGKLKAVHGNSDNSELRQLLPERLVFEADGVKIGIVHEGSLSIMDTTALRYLALEMGVDVLIFGHIHRPLIEKSDVILICPGSPTKPRLSDPSVVLIDIEAGKISPKIVEIEGKACGFIDFSRDLENDR